MLCPVTTPKARFSLLWSLVLIALHIWNWIRLHLGKLASKFGFGLELETSKSSAMKFKPDIKKEIATAAFNTNLNLLRNENKKRKKMTSDISPTPVKGGCAPIITKFWCFKDYGEMTNGACPELYGGGVFISLDGLLSNASIEHALW
ncbi:hypothetical protein DITRI_Ditri01bG0139500 [Diplodiscus trichospermus]